MMTSAAKIEALKSIRFDAWKCDTNEVRYILNTDDNVQQQCACSFPVHMQKEDTATKNGQIFHLELFS